MAITVPRRCILLQHIRDALVELVASGQKRPAIEEQLNEILNDVMSYRHPGTHVKSATSAEGKFQIEREPGATGREESCG